MTDSQQAGSTVESRWEHLLDNVSKALKEAEQAAACRQRAVEQLLSVGSQRIIDQSGTEEPFSHGVSMHDYWQQRVMAARQLVQATDGELTDCENQLRRLAAALD